MCASVTVASFTIVPNAIQLNSAGNVDVATVTVASTVVIVLNAIDSLVEIVIRMSRVNNVAQQYVQTVYNVVRGITVAVCCAVTATITVFVATVACTFVLTAMKSQHVMVAARSFVTKQAVGDKQRSAVLVKKCFA